MIPREPEWKLQDFNDRLAEYERAHYTRIQASIKEYLDEALQVLTEIDNPIDRITFLPRVVAAVKLEGME